MSSEFFDVLIIGAGLSGIGAACHLSTHCPDKSFLILEGRNAIGGTWDIFRYPGVRSDSDIFTFGYSFKPWTGDKAIASGASIRDYICEAAEEFGVTQRIRFGHRVISADWSTADARWSLQVLDLATGQFTTFTCRFLLSCTGCYDCDAGYTPSFSGRENFKGLFIHPQQWPEDLDYSGKRIIVIGSGATAVTLVPALTDKAAHVTMLQRSPSYVASVPERATLALKLRRFLPEKVVYRLSRTFYISSHMLFFKFCKKCPGLARKLLLKMASIQLGKRFDLAHFTPSYKPWDERMLAVPDGDLFKTLREGKATVVTDQIETFTNQGIKLKSGRELSGDIIVSATGFNMQYFGGISIRLDGQPFNINQAVTYRALMLSDLPNAALIFGYTNAAWTLKADICCEYICRVLNYMDRIGMRQCTPRVPKRSFETQPFLDLTSGYVQRAAMQLPRQGTKAPWKLKQNYAYDLTILRYTRLADGHIIFSNPEHAPSEKNTQSKEQLSEGISAEVVNS